MANREDLVFLAVDLGAESGRVVAGMFDGERIALEEVSSLRQRAGRM